MIDFNEVKKHIIIFIIFYLIISIFVYMPIFVSSVAEDGSISINNFIDTFTQNFINPFGNIEQVFALNSENMGMFMSGLGYVFVMVLLAYLYYRYKYKTKHDYEGTENGSSEWAKGGEEFRKLSDGSEVLNKKEGFILSKKHFLGTDQRKVKINKNILVIGGSGAGKSACYVKPNIMQKLGSYVITDPKGEMYRDTANYLKADGYNIQVLNLIETEYSDRYNPLAHVKDHNDVNILAETIVKSGKDKNASGDTFWDDSAMMLLKACIYYVKSLLPEDEQNLSSCVNIVRAGGIDEKVMDRLFIDELKPEHPGRKEYESIKLAADKTKQSIAISLVSKLKDFDTPNIAKVTAINEIDFMSLYKHKTALYIITPPDHSTYDYILSIFFSQLFTTLYSEAYKLGGTLENPIYMLLDEFVNIGQIPDFPKKLSTTRSYGISVSVIVQALDQLEAMYKNDYETIIGNCDTQLFLGSQSLKTCEYFSKSLGQKTIKIESRSISKDKTETQKQGVSFSEQRQGRELMTVDEIKRLNPNEEILLIRGIRPIRTQKAWFFKYHKDREVIGRYKITNITDTPKPVEIDPQSFNVQAHLDEIDRKIKEFKMGTSNNVTATSGSAIEFDNEVKEEVKPVVTETKKSEEFDLQKELEKKFDELFGDTDSDIVD